MTNCGYERESTWQYVENVLMPGLKKCGVDLAVIESNKYSNTEIIDKNGFITLPAFKKVNGKKIMFRTHCNQAFKVKPAFNWIREQGVTNCINWIGISTDESSRQRKPRKRWIKYSYPLIDLNISRQECIKLVAAAGWPRPARSSCLMCPQQSDKEWLDLKNNHPGDWRRAIAIDKMLRTVDPDVYLHESLLPLDEAL